MTTSRVTCYACTRRITGSATRLARAGAGGSRAAAADAVLLVCGRDPCVAAAHADRAVARVLGRRLGWLTVRDVRERAGLADAHTAQRTLGRLRRRGWVEIHPDTKPRGGRRQYRVSTAAPIGEVEIVTAAASSGAARPTAPGRGRTEPSPPQPPPTPDVQEQMVAACGYVHRARLSIITAAAVRRELGHWARSRGLRIDTIFSETAVGDRTALHDLCAELRERARGQGRAVVVVPSAEHLAVSSRVQDSILDELDDMGAEVVVMDDAFSGRSAAPLIAKPSRMPESDSRPD